MPRQANGSLCREDRVERPGTDVPSKTNPTRGSAVGRQEINDQSQADRRRAVRNDMSITAIADKHQTELVTSLRKQSGATKDYRLS